MNANQDQLVQQDKQLNKTDNTKRHTKLIIIAIILLVIIVAEIITFAEIQAWIYHMTTQLGHWRP